MRKSPIRVLAPCLALAGLIGAPSPASAKKQPVLQLELAKGKAKIFLIPQLRLRLEYDQDRDFADTTERQIFSHRARLTLGAKLFDRFTFLIQVQDVRAWGEEKDTLGDFSADGFDLHQGWGEVRLVKSLSFRAGRMEITHDNHRLVGNVNWTQQARAFDGALLRWTGKRVQAHLLYAKLTEAHAQDDTIDGDADFAGLWARLTMWKFFRPSISYLIDIDQDEDVERIRHTAGAHITGNFKFGLAYTVEFFVQAGKQNLPDATGALREVDILAWMVAAKVGYILPVKGKPSFWVWVDVLSGDSDPADNTDRVFHTMFATNHKFYGFMDYFLNIPAHTGRRGLLDFGFRAKLGKLYGLTAFIDYHLFRLVAKDAADRQHLGHEIDITAMYTLFKYWTLQTGYSVIISAQALRDLRGGGTNEVEHWFYLQSNLQF